MCFGVQPSILDISDMHADHILAPITPAMQYKSISSNLTNFRFSEKITGLDRDAIKSRVWTGTEIATYIGDACGSNG